MAAIPDPGGPAMALAMFVGGAEALCYAFVFFLGRGPLMLHLVSIYAATGPALGAFWFVLPAKFAGVRAARGGWLAAVLVTVALVLVVAVGVDTSLLYPSAAGLTALSFAHVNVAGTPVLFTVQLAWFYVLIVAGMVLLFWEALRSWSLYRSQVEAVVASVGASCCWTSPSWRATRRSAVCTWVSSP